MLYNVLLSSACSFTLYGHLQRFDVHTEPIQKLTVQISLVLLVKIILYLEHYLSAH